MNPVPVLVDHADDVPTRSSLELLTLARRLGEPVAVLPGPAAPALVEALGRYGVGTVHVAVPAGPPADPADIAAAALVAVAGRAPAAAVLIPAGPRGAEIAARVAVRLDAGLITDAVDVRAEDGGVLVTQSVFAGTWLADSQVHRGTPIVTVRPHAVEPEPVPEAEPDAGTGPAVEPVSVVPSAAAQAVRVVAREPKTTSGRPALTDATTVVAGGRGVGSAEGFALIERLADVLGGAVGASRAATDLSWAPHELQIGQTGSTVTPQLYLAGGISGAVQHRAGMQGSRTIVAVNKDPHAPILQFADFGVVGDLHKVFPALIDEIAKRKG